MINILLTFISLVMLTLSSVAQNCNSESLIQVPGTLKSDAPYNSGKLSATDLAKNKLVLATISNMIKAKYTPMGVAAGFHLNYGYPVPYRPAYEYAYSIIPRNFYCNGNSIKVEVETSTYFSISVNLFDREIYEPFDNSETTSGTGFHYISDMPVEKDGYWYFKEKVISLVLGMPGSGKKSEWLITYDGQLPFAYATKKEFLQTQQKILIKAMHMAASGFKDVLERIENEKKYKEAEFKNDPEKLKKYMKMDYLDTKARYEKLLADNEKKFQSAFDKIEKQLQMTEAELNQQAIVKEDPYDHLSYLFTDDDDPFGQVLIKPNPAYFKKLPKSSPQFFWIFLAGSHIEPIAAKFMTDIMKTIDFATLKNMLGK